MASRDKVQKKKGKPSPLKSARNKQDEHDSTKATLIKNLDSTTQHGSPVPTSASEDISKDSGKKVDQRTSQDPGTSYTSFRSNASTTVSSAPRKNKVEPSSNQGSSVSLRSREAWSEPDSVTPLQNSDSLQRTETDEGTDTYAYVPYTYAKQCIARIVEDMKAMKKNHIRVVGEIDKTYRCIEDETQAHFDSFVLSLQNHYNNKVKVFRQVVELHQHQFQQKQQYWDNTLESFSLRNKSLLNDKKKLLIQNKVEFDRLKNEKETAVAAITERLDQREREKNELKSHYEEKIRNLEKEIEKFGGSPKGNLLVPAKDKDEVQTAKLDNSRNTSEESQDIRGVMVLATTAAAVANVAKDEEKMDPTTKDAEIKKLQQDKKSLEKDLKKLRKQQMKQSQDSVVEIDYLKKLLGVIVTEVVSAQNIAPDAKVVLESRLQEAMSDLNDAEIANDNAKEKYDGWALSRSQKKGKEPRKKDVEGSEEGKNLNEIIQRTRQAVEDAEILVKALTMLQSGEVPGQLQPKTVHSSSPDDKSVVVISDSNYVIAESEENDQKLIEENELLKTTNQELVAKIEDLEEQLAAAYQPGVTFSDENKDSQELSKELSDLQQQLDDCEKTLRNEKSAHYQTQMELESLQQQLVDVKTEMENLQSENETQLDGVTLRMQADIDNLNKKLKNAESRVDELEAAALANAPLDFAKEISAMKAKIVLLENEKDDSLKEKVSLEASNKVLQSKIKNLDKKGQNQQTSTANFEKQLKESKTEKEKEIKAIQAKHEKKEAERKKLEEKKIAALEKKISQLEVTKASESGTGAKTNVKQTGDDKDKEKLQAAKAEIAELKARIKQLEMELKSSTKSGGTSSVEAGQERKRQERVLKELEKLYEAEKKKNEKNEANLKKKDEELASSSKENKEMQEELKRLRSEMSSLGVAAKEGFENAKKVKSLEAEMKKLKEENRVLTENFNAERVLRKKYYNMVEDMKGKIRVYCRVRPMVKSELDRGNHSVCKSPDEYSINIQSDRGLKEFQFDQVFMPETTQEKVFEDTNNLIQSAIDGYNVCIFAYGQTGSGKTFTIIGDKAQNHPGVAPRAFQRIFELIEESKSKFSFKVSVYMLELYNDKLLDLFSKNHDAAAEEKMEIKKDKKGMVVIQGAEIKYARSAKDLSALFDEGSKTRHVASTNMNAESSRSHLIIGIVLESTNKTTGQVVRGKLSLVDLAGSERASKTGASAQQLKEAMSINKSLSALGDVISALSSEQSFIPYRNNKLTMLMQDSLGGNAKTLMFVNVSPADYNADETVTSLTYASRVKLITNDASKNSESKEISRLRNMIVKLKKGDKVEDEEV